jgi:hypothetical protein
MCTGYLFPWGKFAWGESWPPLTCILVNCYPGVNLPGEIAGLPYHVYRLFVPLGSELASPTVDTDDLFPWGKFAWGESWPPLTCIPVICSTGVNLPGERAGIPYQLYRSFVPLGRELASPNIDTGDSFPWGKFAWGESWPPLTCVPVNCSPGVNLPGERAGLPEHVYRLIVPLVQICLGRELASPTMYTGHLFSWGERCPPLTCIPVNFFAGVNLPGAIAILSYHVYR